MIEAGATIQGSSHKLNNVKNQDAFLIGQAPGFEIGVMGDGVSLKSNWTYSQAEIASNACVMTCMETLKQNLRPWMDDQQILELIHQSFEDALRRVALLLKKMEIPFYDCQTTLMAAVFRNGQAWFGFAGDGGAVCVNSSQHVSLHAACWKTSSAVNPLGAVKDWRFAHAGSVEEPIRTLILATDGIYDNLASLQGNQIYVSGALIGKFMELADVPADKRDEALHDLLESIPSHDDKTAIVFIDDKIAQTAKNPDLDPDADAQEESAAKTLEDLNPEQN